MVILLFLLLLLRSLAISPFWWNFAYVTVLNPTIEVVTFCLHRWCMLSVFLLPAFTNLAHKCQDLLSECDGMHVCTDLTSVYSLIWKSFMGMESEPILTPREKSLYQKILPRGGWNPRCCMTQDSEANIPPMSYSGPWQWKWFDYPNIFESKWLQVPPSSCLRHSGGRPPWSSSGKASASRVGDLRIKSHFPLWSCISDLKTSTLVVTLPDSWHYRVSAVTDWPGASILWLGERVSLFCNGLVPVYCERVSLFRNGLVSVYCG